MPGELPPTPQLWLSLGFTSGLAEPQQSCSDLGKIRAACWESPLLPPLVSAGPSLGGAAPTPAQ